MAFPKTLNTNDPQAVHKFLGGRNAYNWQRKFIRLHRDQVILSMWASKPELSKAEIARQLGVNRSTVTRAIERMRDKGKVSKTCPLCQQAWQFDVTETAVKNLQLIHDLMSFDKEVRKEFPQLFR
jgi:DNA-binding CsgD family transcriptional regulator